MPLVPVGQNVLIPQQVLPNLVQAYVQQQNFGQAIGEVIKWNPDQEAMAPIWLNAGLRKVLDRMTFFGTFVKGQLMCPQATTAGSATVTNGSNTVQGTNTSWTNALVGQQFRVGYNNPIYTIVAVDPVGQVLQLELPWGGQNATSGYFIVQYYYNLGPNIKYLKLMVNMQLGYKFKLHFTQDSLDSIDPWRQNQNWPWAAAPMPLDPNGNYLIELYPASWIQQAFPFMAYIQPPNLSADTDSFPPYIRSDVITKYAIAQALVIGGPKHNEYYDAAESQRKMAEFEAGVSEIMIADENLYRKNMSLEWEDWPEFDPGGALFSATHAVGVPESGAYGDY
jgi:hypothetical protein